MGLYHIIILALIQGITEFLPVSSSGHLVLAHALMNDATEGDRWGSELAMDVAVHIGTLFSVLVYFRKDIFSLARGMLGAVTGKGESGGASLGINVLLASLPVIAAGLALEMCAPQWLRDPFIIAWTTVIFGIVLWVSDRYFPSGREIEKMSLRHALFIGIMQVLALVPGVSRSGITMTASRFLGYGRTGSARFSMFLAIVAISGAGALKGWDIVESGNFEMGADLLAAAAFSWLSGLVAIHLMMRWLSNSTFTPFAIYRVILGAVLFAVL